MITLSSCGKISPLLYSILYSMGHSHHILVYIFIQVYICIWYLIKEVTIDLHFGDLQAIEMKVHHAPLQTEEEEEEEEEVRKESD